MACLVYLEQFQILIDLITSTEGHNATQKKANKNANADKILINSSLCLSQIHYS